MPDLLTAFALIAAVLMGAALTSGVVERAPVSAPMIFLGLGWLLGPRGFGLLHVDAYDTALETVAIVSLAFVLFLDAVNLRFDDLRHNWRVPVLSLGPGTLLTVAIVAVAAGVLFGLPPVSALLLGAILASVDPVVLRDVLRDERIPRSIRDALQIEAGTNDVIVLPLVLVLRRSRRDTPGGSGTGSCCWRGCSCSGRWRASSSAPSRSGW